MSLAARFVQVNGTVGTTNIKWPFEFKDVAKAFSFVKVSFDWPSVGCVLSQTTGNSFYVRLLGYTLFPPALIFAMFLPTLWAAAAGRGAALTNRMAGMAIRKALLLLFVVYPKVRSASRTRSSWICHARAMEAKHNGSKAAVRRYRRPC